MRRLGIIPARAGFTRLSPRMRRRSADHPRSRGVYTVIVRYLSVTVGSSPLARGLHARIDTHVADLGIIPARAGFTLAPFLGSVRWPDHPRSRGVYSATAGCRAEVAGSSPLARGLRPDHVQHVQRPGIIPARAGVTFSWTAATPPRGGSSPLARGLLVTRDRYRPGCGIIPARAGFTYASCRWCGRQADHPRSRGVYPSSVTQPRNRLGSSPLARGLPG